jgi:hypothetical protein
MRMSEAGLVMKGDEPNSDRSRDTLRMIRDLWVFPLWPWSNKKNPSMDAYRSILNRRPNGGILQAAVCTKPSFDQQREPSRSLLVHW